MRARELMSTPVVSVRPEAGLKEVAEQMTAHGVSGVPVVDLFGQLVGIVSETDILVRLEHSQKNRGLLALLERLGRTTGPDQNPAAHTASEIMTPRVITAGPDASVRELLHLMITHSINRLPIVDRGRVVGIVTRADILRTMARPDSAISADTRWRLLHDLWIDTDALKITTHAGIVTVSGEVGTWSEAELAKRWIAAIEGVVDVDASALRYRIDDRHIRSSTGQPRDFHGRSPVGSP
jgi:CBS domain-containing protein